MVVSTSRMTMPTLYTSDLTTGNNEREKKKGGRKNKVIERKEEERSKVVERQTDRQNMSKKEERGVRVARTRHNSMLHKHGTHIAGCAANHR